MDVDGPPDRRDEESAGDGHFGHRLHDVEAKHKDSDLAPDIFADVSQAINRLPWKEPAS